MKVRWHVPPSSNGWIIQHITVTANIYDCKGYRVLTANNQNTSYLEAWQVVKGRILEKGKPADVDTFRTPAEGPCRKGQIYVLGKVQFLPLASYTLSIPPWSYGNVPEAPDMLTLQPVPSSWSDSGAVVHSMLVNFDCCSYTDESVAGFPF